MAARTSKRLAKGVHQNVEQSNDKEILKRIIEESNLSPSDLRDIIKEVAEELSTQVIDKLNLNKEQLEKQNNKIDNKIKRTRITDALLIKKRMTKKQKQEEKKIAAKGRKKEANKEVSKPEFLEFDLLKHNINKLIDEGKSSKDLKNNDDNVNGYANTILNLYARGQSTKEIQANLKVYYHTNFSSQSVEGITNLIVDQMSKWLAKPLKSIYPMLSMDSFTVNIRNSVEQKKIVNTIIGYDLEGNKDCLGIYIQDPGKEKENIEVMFQDLKNRGVKDVFILYATNYVETNKVMKKLFPETKVFKNMVYQINEATKFVARLEKRLVARDLKYIYTAEDENQMLDELEKFNDAWGEKYPHIYKTFEADFENLVSMFDYPAEIRKLPYTFSLVETFHTKMKKVTSQKSFKNMDAVEKTMYLGIQSVQNRWTQNTRDWKIIYKKLNDKFNERIVKNG